MFNAGELLIQQRSAKKKIGPNQWDLSVAEHLSAGETFAQAVGRGLDEELGIAAAAIQGPLAPMHRRKLVQGNFIDYECVESYRMDGFEGTMNCNPEEVSDTAFIALPDLKARMSQKPEDFTSWFRDEIALVNFFEQPVP